MQLRNKRIATMCVLLVAARLGWAQSSDSSTSTDTVPHLVKFSGTVKDDAGHPRAGIAGITFALYKDQQGGAPLWMETQNVALDSAGRYTVQLGATEPDGLPIDVFASGDARWLGIAISGQTEGPRVLLMAVPYALKAADAATVGGLPPSAFVRANPQDDASNGNDSVDNTCRYRKSRLRADTLGWRN
jgi:trimeric autotransporter adhesin